MKKFSSLLLVCFSILFFAACKKDSDNGPTYYIKANIGGTEKTYSAIPIAVQINQGGTYSLAISAAANANSSEGLGLQINKTSGPITAGTYSDASNSNDYVIAGIYNPGTSDISAIFGAGLKISVSAPLNIVISEITDSKVSGTFSGEFYNNSGTGTDSLLITNGNFNIPIQ